VPRRAGVSVQGGGKGEGHGWRLEGGEGGHGLLLKGAQVESDGLHSFRSPRPPAALLLALTLFLLLMYIILLYFTFSLLNLSVPALHLALRGVPSFRLIV
jgi:hypothetical protein